MVLIGVGVLVLIGNFDFWILFGFWEFWNYCFWKGLVNFDKMFYVRWLDGICFVLFYIFELVILFFGLSKV